MNTWRVRLAARNTVTPFGKVPVIVNDDLVLYESVAIVEYLDISTFEKNGYQARCATARLSMTTSST